MLKYVNHFNNKTIYGSYVISATIFDSETEIQSTWLEYSWLNGDVIVNHSVNGVISDPNNNIWSFVFGPFDKEGVLIFSLFAQDINGNEVQTEIFWLKTTSVNSLEGNTKINYIGILISSIPLLFLFISLIDSLFRIKNKYNSDGN